MRWEACQTLNGSWGYNRYNLVFKSPDLLVRMLVDTVSKNGNMLLNIDPNGRGAITPVDRESPARLGAWMELHEDSVVGAGPVEYAAPSGTILTQQGSHLYLHLLHWPFEHVHLPGLAGRVGFVRFLHDGSEVARTPIDPEQQAWNVTPGGQPPGTLTLNLPTVRPHVEVPVIELFLLEE